MIIGVVITTAIKSDEKLVLSGGLHTLLYMNYTHKMGTSLLPPTSIIALGFSIYIHPSMIVFSRAYTFGSWAGVVPSPSTRPPSPRTLIDFEEVWIRFSWALPVLDAIATTSRWDNDTYIFVGAAALACDLGPRIVSGLAVLQEEPPL
jgi:hypothetical protein